MNQTYFLNRTKILFVFTLLTLSLITSTSNAEELASPHHYFNARLLEEGEHQVNIIGNYKYGLYKRLEIGTQGLFLLGGVPNLYFKHKMFDHANGQTSAVGHLLFMNSSVPILLGESEKVFQIIGPVGIVHSFSVNTRHEFGLGLHNVFLRTPFGKNVDANMNITALSFSYDYIFTRSIYMNLVLAAPIWIYGRFEDPSAEIEINSLIAQSGYSTALALGFATIVAQIGDSTFIEGGFISIAGSISPYANVFWRFK